MREKLGISATLITLKQIFNVLLQSVA